MSLIRRIFIKLDMNDKNSISFKNLKTTDTVKSLKDKLKDREGEKAEGVKLYYLSKVLEHDDVCIYFIFCIFFVKQM